METDQIKLIEKKGRNILLDVNSGSLHLLDETATAVLKKYIDGAIITEEAEQETLNELLMLKKEGTLFTEDAGTLPKEIPTSLKSICLNVAHTCNLACPYCFAAGGDYKGKAGLMSLEVGKKAIDFLLINSEKRPIVEVDFFGGEPLLNFEVVKEVLHYGNKHALEMDKSIKWSMTTNGVLLTDEIADFLVENKVGIIISIDGKEETHNRHRYFKSGGGSYAQTVANAKKFIQKTNDYVIRGTYTGYNLNFEEDVIALREHGFKHISMEPVVTDGSNPWDIQNKDLETIEKSYDRLADLYLNWYQEGNPIDFFHFNISLEGGPCLYKRVAACGAGFEYLAITPDGTVYPCHQLIEDAPFIMGNIMEDTVNLNEGLSFKDINIYSKDSCKSCWARFYCSGGCHGNNFHLTGDLKNPYTLGCELQKKRLETALYVQVEKLLNKNDDIKRNDEITKEKIREKIKE